LSTASELSSPSAINRFSAETSLLLMLTTSTSFVAAGFALRDSARATMSMLSTTSSSFHTV
jgi:hypothetical protein